MKKERKSNAKQIIKINYDIEDKYTFEFDYKRLSRQITKKVFELECLDYDFSYNLSLVDKTIIKKINKEQRDINLITDVLSFPNISFKKPSDFRSYIKDGVYDISILDMTTKTIFLGDVVICYDKILSQSIMYKHSVKREFSFLLVHSLLHLLGYDHMNIKDERKMFKKQEDILNSLNILR
jgi:probable rRNA maturation factor